LPDDRSHFFQALQYESRMKTWLFLGFLIYFEKLVYVVKSPVTLTLSAEKNGVEILGKSFFLDSFLKIRRITQYLKTIKLNCKYSFNVRLHGLLRITNNKKFYWNRRKKYYIKYFPLKTPKNSINWKNR
jgi:hypothetical protein